MTRIIIALLLAGHVFFLANLAKIVYKQEALILTALGVNETRRRNYSKPLTGFPCASRLYCCIQRQHVGLFRYTTNDINNFADLFGRHI